MQWPAGVNKAALAFNGAHLLGSQPTLSTAIGVDVVASGDAPRSEEVECCNHGEGSLHNEKNVNDKTHGVKQNGSRSKMTNNERQTNLTLIRERKMEGYGGVLKRKLSKFC